MKLFLGIPSAGSPAQPFLDSLTQLNVPSTLTAFERGIVTGNFVPAQRELLVERGIESGADVLVMCDDDMVLPKETLVRLLRALSENDRVALVGALYYSRDGFRPMVVDAWDPARTGTAVIPAFDAQPVDVAGVGFGCVAMRLSAIKELAPPYFEAHVFVERNAGRVRVCNEDYLFCKRLRDARWRVQLDAGLRCGHYDRAAKRVVPQAWEPADRTNRVRMAAVVNGTPQLVDADEGSPSVAETHVKAALEYLIVS